MSEQTINHKKKSEQIQDIIDRMPNKFGFWVTGIVIGLTTLIFTLGWVISYPDTVTGTIVVNSKYSPIKLVANSAGKITLFNYKPKDNINEDDYAAVIQNPANTDDIKRVVGVLRNFDVNHADVIKAYPLFPSNVSLGEINVKYYTFLNALQQLYNYRVKNVFEKQEEDLKDQIVELTALLENNNKLKNTREANMKFAKKISDRDSVLLSEKVTAEDDADHSKISFLNSKESFQSIHNEIKTNEQQIDNNKNKLQQLYIQKNDKEKQMHLDMLSAYDDLKDNIKAWEQKYVFKAPMNGRIEFSKFWSNNQYIQAGEDIFTIVPKENKIIGQVELPAHGAGKVKIGQEVIIKLDNYPYEEYGSVEGEVTSISLTSNIQKVNNQNNIDTYLVEVALPKGLTTNYGSRLEFKYEIKGSAEIISKKRKLIQRLFDNLKYSTEEK